jgi:hypothetical protein
VNSIVEPVVSSTVEPVAPGAVELKPEERDVLAEAAAAFAGRMADPETRERYLELGRAVGEGSVPEPLVPSLEAMLELLLQSGQVRLRHGPEAEGLLSDVYYRTPRGAGLRQAARDVTRALEALRGQTLEKLSVMAGPGRHTLVVDTDRCRLTLKLDAAGARVDKVEVGG